MSFSSSSFFFSVAQRSLLTCRSTAVPCRSFCCHTIRQHNQRFWDCLLLKILVAPWKLKMHYIWDKVLPIWSTEWELKYKFILIKNFAEWYREINTETVINCAHLTVFHVFSLSSPHSRGWGWCLDDAPVKEKLSLNSVLPGVLYSAAHQCQLQYGSGSLLCDDMDVRLSKKTNTSKPCNTSYSCIDKMKASSILLLFFTEHVCPVLCCLVFFLLLI